MKHLKTNLSDPERKKLYNNSRKIKSLFFPKATERGSSKHYKLKKRKNQLDETKNKIKFLCYSDLQGWVTNQQLFSTDFKAQNPYHIFFQVQKICNSVASNLFSKSKKPVVCKYYQNLYVMNYFVYISNVRKIWKKYERFGEKLMLMKKYWKVDLIS